MVKASDFVAAVIREYERGCGYIWGTTGQTWTEALQQKGSKQNNAKTQAYGRRWLGYTVYDCSGLPYATLKQLGLAIPHGCNSIYDNGYLSEKGKTSAFPPERRLPGMAVFLADGSNEHHMGTYIGGGWVVEAKGTQTGVVVSRWEHWHEAGYYKNMEYDLPADWTPTFRFELTRPAALPIVRKGDAGPYVRYLQVLLREKFGKPLTVDNYYGDATLIHVHDFQRTHGLAVDGAVGPLTWAQLEQAEPYAQELPESIDPDEEQLPKPAAPGSGWAAIIRQLGDIQKELGALIEAADQALREEEKHADS